MFYHNMIKVLQYDLSSGFISLRQGARRRGKKKKVFASPSSGKEGGLIGLRILNDDNQITIFSLIGRKDLMAETM